MERNEQIARIWLSCAELPPRRCDALLSVYGSAQAAREQFSPAFSGLLGKRAYAQMERLAKPGMMERVLARMAQFDIRPVFRGEAEYPELLAHIPDPPLVLYVRGTLPARERAVAIVGSRQDSDYGRRNARAIAQALAQSGVTVVSGMALGIDTAAHQGALRGRGRTVCVLGSGLNVLAPHENEGLARRVLESGGALVSEYPPDALPHGYHFPARNRIISGLAQALVLIEGRQRSGTAITVGHALDQGREVFALPGPVDAPGSAMPLKFLREGARLCTCAEDILSDMRWEERQATAAAPPHAAPPPPAGPAAQPVLNALGRQERSFEQLLEETGLPAAELGAQLTILELTGAVERRAGRVYALRA